MLQYRCGRHPLAFLPSADLVATFRPSTSVGGHLLEHSSSADLSCLSTFLPSSVPSPWLGGVVRELRVLTAPTSPTGKRWRVTTRRAWCSNTDSNFCSASSQLSQSFVSPLASSSATTTASSSLFLATSWEFHLPTFP